MSKHTSTKKHRSKQQKQERELARLRRELERERRQTARLKREVSDLRRELEAGTLADRDQPLRRFRQRGRVEERMIEDASERARHYRKRSFFRFLWDSMMESTVVGIITKIVYYFKRVRVIQMVITIVMAVGAIVLVTVVSAAVLPFLFLATIGLATLALLRSKRMNTIMKKALDGKHIRVLIPPRGAALSEDSFFIRNAIAMAAEDNVAVLVISPYLVAKRGLGGREPYFTARKEARNVYIVRKHYYFILRRRVLDALDGEMTVLY